MTNPMLSGSLGENLCGDSHLGEGMTCMMTIPFGSTEHRGDHKAWSQLPDDEQPWVMRWVNADSVETRHWQKANCRP